MELVSFSDMDDDEGRSTLDGDERACEAFEWSCGVAEWRDQACETIELAYCAMSAWIQSVDVVVDVGFVDVPSGWKPLSIGAATTTDAPSANVAMRLEVFMTEAERKNE